MKQWRKSLMLENGPRVDYRQFKSWQASILSFHSDVGLWKSRDIFWAKSISGEKTLTVKY